MILRLLVLLAIIGPLLGADWPGFRGPGQSGVSPETGLSRSWADRQPSVAWRVALRPGHGGAAVVGGLVYVMDREPGRRDLLRCLAAADGSERWRLAWDSCGGGSCGAAACVPAVADGLVVAVGLKGLAVCCDAVTGAERWRLDLTAYGRGAHRAWGWHVNPVVADGAVLLQPFCVDSGLVAIDLATGVERWRSSWVGEGTYSYGTPRVLRLAGRVQAVVMGNPDRQRDPPAVLSGIDLADGQILWQLRTDRPLNVPVGQPVPLDDSGFLLSAGYGFGCAAYCVRPAEPRWEVRARFTGNQACNAYFHTPIRYDGHLYAQSFDDYHQQEQHGLVCLTPQGERRWRSADVHLPAEGLTTEPVAPGRPGLTLGYGGLVGTADGLLLAVAGTGGEILLVAADPQSCRVLGRHDPLEGSRWTCWAPPALAGRALYLRSSRALLRVDLPQVP